MSDVRLLLADDEHLFRTALRALLAIQDGVSVVAEAASVPEALAMANRHQPDVVLVDLVLPGGDGIAVVGDLAVRQPKSACLVLTSHPSPGALLAAMGAGARGFLPKTASVETLCAAIRCVHRGGRWVDAELAGEVIAAEPSPLSEREAEILALSAAGLRAAQIGDRLALAPGTVRNYLSAATAKVGGRDRAHAVELARHHGWLPRREPS